MGVAAGQDFLKANVAFFYIFKTTFVSDIVYG